MRDNMIIYRSFFEAIKEIPKENQADVWNAVYELGLNNNVIELTGLSKTIFTLIKPQIEANIKRYENGKKPKSKNEAKQEQKISKTEPNNNNNNNNNKNLTDRQNDFYNEVAKYKHLYSKQILREFFDYWSEHGVNDKKMRFEKEKTFGIDRRLKTWAKNSGQFNSFSNSQDTEGDKLVNYINNQLKK